MNAETKSPLPDDVRDAALKALHDLESNDYWRRGDFSDCYDKIRAHIAALTAELETYRRNDKNGVYSTRTDKETD